MIVSLAVAIATALVIVTGSLVPFLNPAWVGFEQRRAEALAWTGYDEGQLASATNAILSDLVLVTGDFDVEVAGAPVLSERERGHMRDVRTAFLGLWTLTLIAAVTLLVAWHRSGRPNPHGRAAFWRSVRRGAGGLAVTVVALGAVAIVAFDVLFEAFHRLLFPAGSYTFDPTSERLVQLFPFRFWQETAIAVGAMIVLVCGAVTLLARRAASRNGDAATGPYAVAPGEGVRP